MRKTFGFTFVLPLIFAAVAFAQEPAPVLGGENLVWDMPQLDAATASTLGYIPLINSQGVPNTPAYLVGVSCEESIGGAKCKAPMLPLPPGMADIRIVAERRFTPDIGSLRSEPSNPLRVLMVAIPVPLNLRLERVPQ